VGSKFYISLPVRDDNRPPTPPKVVKEGEAYRVLVCDPDPQLAAVLGQTLRQHGYDVRTAHSGRRLLAHLAHGDVDVVITDVLLSDMSAGQLLEGIQSMNELAFKLIVHSYAEDGKELRHPGIDLFVQRPIPQDVLVNRIQDLTRGSAPAAGRAKLAAAAAGARKSARPAGVGVAPSPPPMERQP
jgi:DNA-binding response OmpR family regulator